MRRTSRRLAIALVAVSACAVVGLRPSGVVTASNEAVDAGTLGVADPADRNAPRQVYGADDVFAIILPDDAACPGDSYHDNWRVQSFVVPAADRVADLLFSGVGPEGVEGDARWPLRQVNSFTYVDELTLANEAPGQPGVIDQLPPFATLSFLPDELPPGDYRLGVACTLERSVGRYWDIALTTTLDETGSGLTWEFESTGPDTSTSSGPSMAPFAIGGVVIAAVVLLRRRTTTRTTSGKGAP
jgi:hypothetical protein